MIMAIVVRTRRSSKSSSEAKFLGHKRGRKQHNRWAPCGQWCPLAKRRLTWWMDSLWKITSNHANLKSQPLFYSCQFETPFQVLMVGWRTSRKEAAPPPRPYQKWKMGHERQPCTVGFLIRKKSRELNYKIFRFLAFFGSFWLWSFWVLRWCIFTMVAMLSKEVFDMK